MYAQVQRILHGSPVSQSKKAQKKAASLMPAAFIPLDFSTAFIRLRERI